MLTPLQHKLHWMAVCFRLQFNILIIIFKTLNGTGPGYLQYCLPLITSVCPTQSSREGKLWTPSANNADWWGPGTEFSLPLPLSCGTYAPQKGEVGPTLLTFWKGMKTWLCDLAWGSQWCTQLWDWLAFRKSFLINF